MIPISIESGPPIGSTRVARKPASRIQALRILRRDPATRDIPIIMISGNEQATEQFYAQRIGADDFMKKPFSRSEVFVRIERLLDHEKVLKRPAPLGSQALANPAPAEAAASTPGASAR